MLTDISGNSFSTLGNPQDIDVQRFISAASITSSTEIQALDTLVFNLKQNNIWDKMQAIYPFVGGTSTSTRFNLKDQRDSDAAFRLVFSGSWTYSSTGVRMSTSANTNYIRTFYFPSANTTSNSVHISMYFNGTVAGQACLIGAVVNTGVVQATDPAIQIFVSNITNVSTTQARNTTDSIATTNQSGFHLGNRSASNAMQYYYNGNLSGSNASTSTSLTGFSSDILLLNRGGDRAYYHPGEARFATIGTSLTSGEVSALYNAIQAFQTTLGRQVGTSATSPVRPTQTTLPTVTYNPKQLYGNDLYVWVDMTDWRNMYNSQTGNTNISSTGYVPATSATEPSNHTSVRRMEDMAGTFTGSNNSRKFYSLNTLNDTIIPESSTTGNSTFSNVFYNGQWDTNKGIFSGSVVASTNLRHVVNLAQPINFLATNSTLTICNYMYISHTTTPAGSYYSFGMTFPRFITTPWLGFGSPANSSNLIFYIPSSSTSASVTMWSNNWATSYTQFNNKTIMLTAVISGRGYDIYANNVLLTSGTIPTVVTYPFSAAATTYNLAFGYQPAFGNFYQSSRPIWESFIANSYTSPQQINLLYDYFRVKFKDRQVDLA